MKRKQITKALILVAVSISLFSACQKKYFFDSGTHNGVYNGSILAYLKSKPAYFDTLTRVIELAEMNDVFDKENITFFAPTSSTIYKSVKVLNRYLRTNGRDTVARLEQIKPQAWRELLSLYVFKGTNKLKDYPQIDTLNMLAFPGQGYTSRNGRTMNIGVLYNDAPAVKYAGYRQLYLAYIPSFVDPQKDLIYIPVASSDIEPSNGIVHVLAQNRASGTFLVNKHNFGFTDDVFITTVQSYGILPAK
ncbi:fasciclin domain-containing protein [Pedobacter endophyticus]|uniref:FAS1 domain-containing protein n=1 Tax=Pedobacter endophyticus TaxID=2789740 RepID=A0A7U3SQY1_9SPHI|nr:fasciclin domain-containing protein [Pedobacter endophyticus]QPH38876.1 hypothetical protein IZT61_17685 [Pedobacter endophyticus]